MSCGTYFGIPSSCFNSGLVGTSTIMLMSTPQVQNNISGSLESSNVIITSNTKKKHVLIIFMTQPRQKQQKQLHASKNETTE